MRSYGLYDFTRGLTLALVAGVAGFGLWAAGHVGTATDGRFWIAMAIVAGAGFLLAIATHVGTWTKGLRLRTSPTTFIAAFLPVLVCVGWVLIASQPGNGWQEGRITSWSASLGISGIVHSLGIWAGVLAFGLGVVFGLSLDGVPQPAATVDETAADEPTMGERRYSEQTAAQPAPQTAPQTASTDAPSTRVEEPTAR